MIIIILMIIDFVTYYYYFLCFPLKEESLRGKPGYEHLNEPLHILVEAEASEVPANIVDVRLKQAKEIIEELLKPVVGSEKLPG